MQARRIVLANRPVGIPRESDFRTETLQLPALRDGEALVETLYASVDPYMRGRMAGLEEPAPPHQLGDVITGTVIGRVVDSRHSALRPGDLVQAGYGWQTAAVVRGPAAQTLDPSPLPVTASLGVLGSTGITAYFGMREVGRPRPGETVVVSGAAGAVGSVAGQVARLAGARVVGIAGSGRKCEMLQTTMGFHAAVDYKARTFRADLAASCPNGVDVYFDNVGGPVSNAVLPLIAHGARIAICGQTSQYNLGRFDDTPAIPTLILNRGAVMAGVHIMNYRARYAEARAQLADWVLSGQLHYEETIVEGFDHIVEAFQALFTGGSVGKLLVHVAD
jgi:NADPH-dependent curcumin reductase CurA